MKRAIVQQQTDTHKAMKASHIETLLFRGGTKVKSVIGEIGENLRAKWWDDYTKEGKLYESQLCFHQLKRGASKRSLILMVKSQRQKHNWNMYVEMSIRTLPTTILQIFGEIILTSQVFV